MFSVERGFFAFLNLVTPGAGSEFQFHFTFNEHGVVGTGVDFFQMIAEGVVGELFDAADRHVEFRAAAQREFRLLIQNRCGTEVLI